MRNTDGLWRGGPGRRAGIPNKATRKLRAFLQDVLQEAFDDPGCRRLLVEQIKTWKIDPKLLTLVLGYAHGRSPLAVDVVKSGVTSEMIVAGTVPRDVDEEDDDATGTPH